MSACPLALSLHSHATMLDRAADFAERVSDKLDEWRVDAEKVDDWSQNCAYRGQLETLLIAAMRGDESPMVADFDRYYEDKAQAAVLADERNARAA